MKESEKSSPVNVRLHGLTPKTGIFIPETGDEIHRIALPCLETTACAFGDPDLSDQFVTTGVHKTAEEEHAGRLFVIRDLKVKGVPAFAFKG